MQGFEKDCYLADLSKIPWDSANIYDDIDDIYEHWHHLFIRVVDQHLPLKRKDIRGDQPPWITPEISAISRRNILFKKFKRNKSADNWEQFKKQRNLVTTLKRKSMKSYFIQASAECAHLGEFWKNSSLYYLPKVLNNNIYIQVLEEGRLVTDNMKIANIFQHTLYIDGVAAHFSILSEHAFASLKSIKLV